MPYQLPQELRTSKLESLPDDLRKMAEEALAEKFDLPKIIPKVKKKPVMKKEPLFGGAYGDRPPIIDMNMLFIQGRGSGYAEERVVNVDNLQGADHLYHLINDSMRRITENIKMRVGGWGGIQFQIRFKNQGTQVSEGGRIDDRFMDYVLRETYSPYNQDPRREHEERMRQRQMMDQLNQVRYTI